MGLYFVGQLVVEASAAYVFFLFCMMIFHALVCIKLVTAKGKFCNFFSTEILTRLLDLESPARTFFKVMNDKDGVCLLACDQPKRKFYHSLHGVHHTIILYSSMLLHVEM